METVAMAPADDPLESGVGSRAFRSAVHRVLWKVAVGDGVPALQTNAAALTRANGLADRGDFLGAIRVLGDVRIELESTEPEGLLPEDVEQALGDLRRALVKAPAGQERDASARLMEAARAEASEGRWHAAWELIEEADARLAGAY